MVDENVRILLVEDDEDDFVIVRDILDDIEHQTFDLRWVRGLDEATRSLEQEEYDAILTDYRLGSHSGLDLLREVAAQGFAAPVIVLTGQGNREVDLEVMDAGAADYLVKGEITAPLLERSIRYATQQHALLTQLRALSLTDDLTGLNNRRGFQMLAEAQLRLAERSGRPALLLFVDLDGMKQINDLFGHCAGDEALLETAALLQHTFRSSDLCARVGGDEFVVLAVDTPSSDVNTLTERLQQNLEALNAEPGRRYTLSLSIGKVWCDPAHPRPLEELLNRADALMYQQKQQRLTESTGGGR